MTNLCLSLFIAGKMMIMIIIQIIVLIITWKKQKEDPTGKIIKCNTCKTTTPSKKYGITTLGKRLFNSVEKF